MNIDFLYPHSVTENVESLIGYLRREDKARLKIIFHLMLQRWYFTHFLNGDHDVFSVMVFTKPGRIPILVKCSSLPGL